MIDEGRRMALKKNIVFLLIATRGVLCLRAGLFCNTYGLVYKKNQFKRESDPHSEKDHFGPPFIINESVYFKMKSQARR